MILGANPWLILGALSLSAVTFIGGMSVGKQLERTSWLERDQEYQEQLNQENKRSQEVAKIYSLSLQQSQDQSANLRRKLNEQQLKLDHCIPGGGVRFTPAFTGLYNEALQTSTRDTKQSISEAAGTDSIELLSTHIENGRRHKDCRNQLNALIDILE